MVLGYGQCNIFQTPLYWFLHLLQAFINTELYARVSVAVLFYKLADLAVMVGSKLEDSNCQAAMESGKMFLLDLLDFAVLNLLIGIKILSQALINLID